LSLAAHPPVFARLGAHRWHFQHGPIDLILDLHGDRSACGSAIATCWRRFTAVLPELVSELGELRRPAHQHPAVAGPVACRMLAACAPFADERFITPMAAVAGSVADELIELCRQAGVARALINNGGDIAVHLAPGQSARLGICAQADALCQVRSSASLLDGQFEVHAAMPVRGIATSGCRGRSLSLGIADAVTVLAANAAAADAAATLIANAVNCEHPDIVRAPADQLKDDSDLGCRLATVRVPPLPPGVRARALESGRIEAERWLGRGLIYAAALFLQGDVETVPVAA
jgi:ApbE superfamily uncharacterized protein (UPF0280 family)